MRLRFFLGMTAMVSVGCSVSVQGSVNLPGKANNPPSTCTPDCGERTCGDDGCGGLCGKCGEGEYCKDGECVAGECTPECGEKECGFDGCNGLCGTCPETHYCKNGVCMPKGCTPSCEGKVCGDDGCGGICGECGEGEYCKNGTCIAGTCTPDCDGKQCGADGCGGLCGTCPTGQTCTATGTCAALGDVAQWTLMVYLDADNDLEPFAVENDLLEMMDVDGGSSLSIVVLVDRIPGESAAVLQGTGNFDDSRLAVVKNGQLEVLETWGEVNMGKPETLRDFIAYAVEHFPAKHYMLDLWNHGGGISGAVWDHTDGHDNLTIEELTAGIAEGLAAAGLPRLDIVGFDACLMGTYEVAAAMQPYASYLLASEEVEPGTGWDYRAFSVVASNPDISAVDLGTAIVNGYFAQCAQGKKDEMATLSLVDLSRIDKVTEKIEAFVLAIGSPASATVAHAIAQARTQVDEFGKMPQEPCYMVDLVDLLNLIELSGSEGTAKAQLRSAVVEAIVYNKAGPALANAHGLSVYFPPLPQHYDSTYDAIDSAGAWRSFLEAYFGAIASDHSPPAFTNPEKIADVAFDENSVTITGELDPDCLSDVTELRFYFGLADDSGSVRVLGYYPASVDSNGVVKFEWDYTAGVVAQGDTSRFAYVELDLDDKDWMYLMIPFGYRESGASSSQPAAWVIVFDVDADELVSSTLYSFGDDGSVGELIPDDGSMLYLQYPVITPSGTVEWLEDSELGFDPTEGMDFYFLPMPQGIKVFVALSACDAADNCDRVYNIIDL